MYSTNATRAIKSRRIRWTELVARTEDLRKRDHLEDLVVDGRRLLKWVSEQWKGGGAWTGLIWLRTGTGGGLLWMRQ